MSQTLREPPRYLARRSEYGYTDRADLALHGEPEAVPAGYQRTLTVRASRAELQRKREEWEAMTLPIRLALRALKASPIGRERESDLRVIARVLDRVDRDLTRR